MISRSIDFENERKKKKKKKKKKKSIRLAFSFAHIDNVISQTIIAEFDAFHNHVCVHFAQIDIIY